MTASFFVIFDRHGFVKALKTGSFTMDRGQYATEIVIEVPDEAFTPMNLPKVQVTIPTEALRRTFEATVVESEGLEP